MPCFNQAQFLEESVFSVLDQDYTHLELIVADGGSDDGTLDVLTSLGAKDSRLKWFSGKDQGPADAVNKALARSRGTVIGWLNSDDLYMPGAVGKAVKAFAQNRHWIMVYGHGRHIDASGQIIDTYATRQPPQPLEAFLKGCFICQPTVFFQRTMYVLLGGLDAGLNASFDFSYWLKAFSAFGDRIGFVDAFQAQSRLHDACITRRQRRTIALEGMQLLHDHLGVAPAHWLLTYRDELLSGRASLPGNTTLQQELSSVLKEAWDWLSEQDRDRLLKAFEISG